MSPLTLKVVLSLGILLPMVLRQTPYTWPKRLLSSEIELKNLPKIPNLSKMRKFSPRRVTLRKLAVLRTTLTALQKGAIGKHKIRAKVAFSNTFVLGANLTVMLKKNIRFCTVSLRPSSN